MFYVYMIWSPSTGRIYTGQTNDIARRVDEHNGRGPYPGARFTRGAWPWLIVYLDWCSTRIEARRRERELKGLGRRAKVELMLGVADARHMTFAR